MKPLITIILLFSLCHGWEWDSAGIVVEITHHRGVHWDDTTWLDTCNIILRRGQIVYLTYYTEGTTLPKSDPTPYRMEEFTVRKIGRVRYVCPWEEE